PMPGRRWCAPIFDRAVEAGVALDVDRPGIRGLAMPSSLDGNRTRTIRLGICSIQASMLPDLRGGLSVSDRERPLLTPINGTLMARRQVIISSVGHLLGYPGFSGTARVCL